MLSTSDKSVTSSFIQYRWIFFFILLFISFNLQAKEQTARAFIWNDDANYPPFISKNKDGKAQGVFKDIMDELFKRLNKKLVCELYPWKRAQERVKNNLADGMITVVTKKRLQFLEASDPIVTVHERVFASSENPKIQKIMDITKVSQFKDYKVVDYIGAGWAKERYKNLPHVIWAPKSSNAFLMLANGRADIYVMNDFAGIYGIQKQINKTPQYKEKLQKLIMSTHTLSTIEFRLLIRKDSSFVSLIPKINKTLKEMKKDGTYDSILGKILGYMKGKSKE